MRKTLAQQLKAFMDVENLTSQAVADRVRAVQAKAGAKKTVTRQNIDGVLGGIKRPLYLPELAVAMGTDVETLRLGRYGADGIERQRTTHLEVVERVGEADEIALALAVLAKALQKADKNTRKSVEPSLSSLALEPEDLHSISQVVIRLLVTDKTPESRSHDGPKSLDFPGLERDIGPHDQRDSHAPQRRKAK